MKIFVVLCSILLCTSNALALQKDGEGGPLDPNYDIEHGFLVFNKGSTLFASFLPSYQQPNNAQIIYRLDAKDNAMIYLVRDAQQVTMKTRQFDIQRLINGETAKTKADIYLGHFQDGGMMTYEQVEVTFTEQLYLRELIDLGEPSLLQTYDEIDLGRGNRLLVHQIQGAPSYDHIVLLYQHVNCVIEFNTGTSAPREMRLLNRLSFCGPMKPIYYDAESFAAGSAQTEQK